MGQFTVKIRTLFSLGLSNVVRVAFYRLCLRIGVSPLRRLSGQLSCGVFFKPASCSCTIHPSSTWFDNAHYFGWFPVSFGYGSPDWHANPFNGCSFTKTDLPWWNISDFDSQIGDIKTVWESSRFDWVLAMAQRVATGDQSELTRLNVWLADWCQNNKAYNGPNWKCGQEASIRVMHLAMAAHLLDQKLEPEPALIDFVITHLARINSTFNYAIAQDNNHGTSEAAALFIGGSWLELVRPDKLAKRCSLRGRKWLENRVFRLIELDGSFSQYSVNYHRVLLDTLSMVEVWRRSFPLPPFSETFYERCRAAVQWLNAFVQPETGDAPNIGANDGARLLPLSDTDNRDFRPSVQLAAALFCDAAAYAGNGSYDRPLEWLKIDKPCVDLPHPEQHLFDNGGYAVMQQSDAAIYLRYPRFRFRPSHADALHLDFWLAGKNILRDGGSYSYNTASKWLNYFQGTASHNTIQFDDRDQMPRLGRFLFGAWLKNDYPGEIRINDKVMTCKAGYVDHWGVSHRREVSLSDSSMKVTDIIDGIFKKAVLRWRLMPGQWVHNDDQVTNGTISLKIITDLQLIRMEIVEGWESRYYLQKTALPVVEVELDRPGRIVTEIIWT